MYRLIFPSLLALEGSLVLPPHMVKLGHLVVFDEEQGAKRRFEEVRPDLCLLEERQEGSVAIFSFGDWQRSRLSWKEESCLSVGLRSCCNVKELPEGGEEGAFYPCLLPAELSGYRHAEQIVGHPLLCWTLLGTGTTTLRLLFCLPLAGKIPVKARIFPYCIRAWFALISRACGVAEP